VTLDKIHPHYLFHAKSRIKIDQESRLFLRPEQLEEFVKGLGKYSNYIFFVFVCLVIVDSTLIFCTYVFSDFE